MTRDVFNRRRLLIGLSTFPFLSAAPMALAQAREGTVEGGIGGTGIVGVLTEFGSLIVGGNYVRTGEATRYSNGYGGIAKSDLAIGDGMTVEASGPLSALTARRVHVAHPVVGTIESINRGGRRIVVNGVAVDMSTSVRFAVGDRVAVSGLWRGNRVVGSGIATAPDPRDLIAGEVARAGIRSARIIGASEVHGTGLSRTNLGGYATAVGRYDAASKRFIAQRVQGDRFTGAAGPLHRLSVEGYLEPTNRAPNYKLSGLGHSFKRTLQLDDFAGKRVLLNGGYAETFAVENAVILPEAAGARASLMRRLSRGE